MRTAQERFGFAGYLLFAFAAVSVQVALPTEAQSAYATVAILAMGATAALTQRLAFRQRIRDMGFRLGRNVAIGVTVGLAYTALIALVHYALPVALGAPEISANPAVAHEADGTPDLLTAFVMLACGGGILFLAALFGEELAFRGFVLPKLVHRFGPVRGVLVTAVIFGLWHLPFYFSVYEGGASEGGVTLIVTMLLAHTVSSIPLAILYLTTRELYGVSLLHGLIDAVQYTVIGNAAFGQLSDAAVYQMTVTDEALVEILTWLAYALEIGAMLAMCRLARRFVKPEA